MAERVGAGACSGSWCMCVRIGRAAVLGLWCVGLKVSAIGCASGLAMYLIGVLFGVLVSALQERLDGAERALAKRDSDVARLRGAELMR